MISRYNVVSGLWEVGYWINNTTFLIVDLVADIDLVKSYPSIEA